MPTGRGHEQAENIRKKDKPDHLGVLAKHRK